jgi:Ca-activated chloride channel family protein
MVGAMMHAQALAAANLRLADPLWLLALAALPLVLWLRGRARVPVLVVPFASAWHRASLAAAEHWTTLCAAAGLALVIGALARPQKVQEKRDVSMQGYDLVLAIDLSGSMLSEDYEKDGVQMNRLQAIKPVIQAFIERRPTDRIAVVLFSAKAYTLSPLTADHAWLSKQLDRVKIGLIQDGTAIGDALGVSVSRLDQANREANGKRKGAFIVLLTDGGNNMGSITPDQAAQLAKARGIPIYTIGAGRDGLVPFPIFDDTGRKIGYRTIASDLDEESLRSIAGVTGGKFYRAADTGTIEAAFASIDASQKIDFQAKSYLLTTELFAWLAVPGLALFGAGAWISRPR